MKAIVSLDVGATKTRIACVKASQLEKLFSFPSFNYLNPQAKHLSPREIQRAWLLDLKEKLLSYLEGLDYSFIVMAFCGPVGSEQNLSEADNIWGKGSFLLTKAEIEKELGLSIFIINDMTAAVTRYAKMEKYQNEERILAITISSGIGSKLFDVKRGEVFLDKQGRAGEIGKIKILLPHYPLRNLEELASGRGVAFLAKYFAEKEKDYPEDLFLEEDLDLLTRKLVLLALEKDPFALRMIKRSCYCLASVLQSLLLYSSPSKIILLGGFALALGDVYRDSLLMALREMGLPGYLEDGLDSLIDMAVDDDHSGLLGGALFAESFSFEG